MPRRSRPQAAFATGLLWASPLLAAEGFICAHVVRESLRPTPAPLSCASIRADRWSLLPGVEFTGRLSIDLPPQSGGSMRLVVGHRLPFDLEIEDRSRTRPPLPLAATRIDPITLAPADYWLEFGSPWAAPGHAVATSIAALPDRRRQEVVNLGRRAPRVLARLDGYGDSARGRVCAAQLDARQAFASERTFVIPSIDERYFATGWTGVERPADGHARRMLERHAVVLVPSARDGRVRLRLVTTAASGTLAVSVNDLPEMHADARAGAFEWMIPPSAWVAGTNELLFTVIGPAQQPVGVTRLELALQ